VLDDQMPAALELLERVLDPGDVDAELTREFGKVGPHNAVGTRR
jgi:hypothetical protein